MHAQLNVRSTTLVLTLILPLVMPAQEELIHRPFTVSFVPGLSTNGPDGGRVRSSLVFNIVGGYLGRLEGVEVGSVFNLERHGGQGCQLAGALNYPGGDFDGVQMSGGVNLVPGNFQVAQFAGGLNLVIGALRGVQFAPANVAVSGEGAQFGAVNLAGSFTGVHFGAVNVVRSSRGAQFAMVNISEQVEGFQAAQVNIADRMTGFQLGLVNLARELDGEALGLVSIIGNGLHNLGAWYDETSVLNLGVKLGSHRLYNLLTVGYGARRRTGLWLAGLGLGGHIPLQQFFIDIDGVSYAVRDVPFWHYSQFTSLSRLRIVGGWQALSHLAFTAGPSLNWFVSEASNGSELMPDAGCFLARRSGSVWLRAWPGFVAGLQMR